MTFLEKMDFDSQSIMKEIDLECAIVESEICNEYNMSHINSLFTEGGNRFY